MLSGIRVLETNTVGKYVMISAQYSDTSSFHLRSADGIGPIKANINTTDSVFKDGSYFNSVKITNRNMLLTIDLVATKEYPTIEAARQKTYDLFPPGGNVLLEFYTDTLPNPVRIRGYIESNEPGIFTQRPHTIVSIICPEPFFYENEKVVVSSPTDYMSFQSVAGSAPSPITVKKFFKNTSGSFTLGKNSGGTLNFANIPGGSTLEVSFDPLNRYVKISNGQTTYNAYSYITGGTYGITISRAQAYVGFSGTTNADPGFEISFNRMHMGL